MTNLNIYERANYGHASREEILDALAELVAWREMAQNVSLDISSPEEFERYVSDLEEQAGECNNEEHARFDDYKEFFDECVYALPKYWPCADPWDLNLRNAICEIISNSGDE